jgi:hypothetical protein
MRDRVLISTRRNWPEFTSGVAVRQEKKMNLHTVFRGVSVEFERFLEVLPVNGMEPTDKGVMLFAEARRAPRLLAANPGY